LTPKIFCVGFHRTGTSSLRAALERLGYRVCGSVGTEEPDIAARVRDIAFGLLDRYDAVEDNPWPILFRELDERCPGSRFILTTRPADAWLRSVSRFFGPKTTPMRQWIYDAGSPLGNEARYVERFERHNREVLDHFRDRPHDLLVLRITEGEGWPELCGFLGRDVPLDPFPHMVPSKAPEQRSPQPRAGRLRRLLTGGRGGS
jgi:hypothetical protein